MMRSRLFSRAVPPSRVLVSTSPAHERVFEGNVTQLTCSVDDSNPAPHISVYRNNQLVRGASALLEDTRPVA